MGFWDTSCPVISALGRLKQEDSRLSEKEERVMGVKVGRGDSSVSKVFVT